MSDEYAQQKIFIWLSRQWPDLRLGLFSDINSSYRSTNYLDTVEAGIKFILASKPDQVICAGDMIAGQKC